MARRAAGEVRPTPGEQSAAGAQSSARGGRDGGHSGRAVDRAGCDSVSKCLSGAGRLAGGAAYHRGE